MYNILITDIVNKCQFIYDIKPVFENELSTLFDKVLNEISKINDSKNIHISFIDDNECEIYLYEEHVQQGWIWKNLVPIKKLLYKIQAILCLNTTDLSYNKYCQTEIFNMTQEKECQTESLIDDIPLDSKKSESNFLDIRNQHFESNYNLNNNLNRYSWHEEFKHELKDKLNLENFGLYKMPKYFKQD